MPAMDDNNYHFQEQVLKSKKNTPSASICVPYFPFKPIKNEHPFLYLVSF